MRNTLRPKFSLWLPLPKSLDPSGSATEGCRSRSLQTDLSRSRSINISRHFNQSQLPNCPLNVSLLDTARNERRTYRFNMIKGWPTYRQRHHRGSVLPQSAHSTGTSAATRSLTRQIHVRDTWPYLCRHSHRTVILRQYSSTLLQHTGAFTRTTRSSAPPAAHCYTLA